MERSTRKAINFDMDVNLMKNEKQYNSGYTSLKASFIKYGFIHRQYSGYISLKTLTSMDVINILEKIINENPWFPKCVKSIDVTDIAKQHDLMDTVKFIDAQQKQQKDLKKYNENTRKNLNEKDAELITHIANSKMGDMFNKLYNGQIRDNTSDARLLNILAFFTDGDASQIKRIYESSKQYDASKDTGAFISNITHQYFGKKQKNKISDKDGSKGK